MLTKQSTTFRLSRQLLSRLDIYAKSSGNTKTYLIEKAIEKILNNSATQVKKRNNLIKYVGGFQDKTAEELIQDVYKSRKNKKLNSLD